MMLQIEQAPYAFSTASITACSSVFFLSAFFVCKAISRALFGTVYKALPKDKKREWDSYMVSTINALLCPPVFLWAFFTQYDSLLANPYTFHSHLNVFTISLLNGYLLYDLVLSLMILENSKASLLHHCAGMAALTVASATGCVHLYAMLFVFSEISTPFVNMRWFLDTAGFKNHKAYIVNALLMMLVFFVFRVLPIPWLIYQMFARNYHQLRELPAVVQFLAVTMTNILNLLNLYWFYRMCSGLVKALRKKKAHTE